VKIEGRHICDVEQGTGSSPGRKWSWDVAGGTIGGMMDDEQDAQRMVSGLLIMCALSTDAAYGVKAALLCEWRSGIPTSACRRLEVRGRCTHRVTKRSSKKSRLLPATSHGLF